MAAPDLPNEIPPPVLSAWPNYSTASISPITGGLINQTYSLTPPRGRRAILQRLHPVFPPETNLNIDAVTRHLSSLGLATPRLVPTNDNQLWFIHAGYCWRSLTYLDGQTYSKLTNAATGFQAGRLVGTFHRAMSGFPGQLQVFRSHVHDTPRHLARLSQAVTDHPNHPLHPKVRQQTEQVLFAAHQLPPLAPGKNRICHGDLKISNLLFDESGQGLCLIDLDTLTPMPWALEMGDALRSWCNPNREDQANPYLDLELFEAAVTGYQSAAPGLPTRGVWSTLIPGLKLICLELSARFLADALYENYFGWDETRYSTRGEHNLARGISMWELYLNVAAQARDAEKILAKLV